jgi:SAM-dependent methyltransferase
MITQLCAICEKNNYQILYPENFEIKKINERVFSARRLPDKIHYRIVKCRKCGLVYSNPILEYEKIEGLYKKSFTSYDEHIENLKLTYGFYLKELKKYIVGNRHVCSLLEIGCGNGFFLEEALNQGYKNVWGVEPGKKSVDKAKKIVKKNIIVDIFRPGLFKKNFFDVVCCFQTFDHIPDPNGFLKECYSVLKKRGLVLFLNHDASSISAKIMGERSPIIDIEHTYLFDKKTMEKMFKKHNFKVIEIKDATNIHHLSHWLDLFPLSKSVKLILLNILKALHLDKIKIKLNPGNIVLVAIK